MLEMTEIVSQFWVCGTNKYLESSFWYIMEFESLELRKEAKAEDLKLICIELIYKSGVFMIWLGKMTKRSENGEP